VVRRAARFFLCGEDALLTAAELTVSDHALEQKFRSGNDFLRSIGRIDAERRKLVEQAVNLFQIGERCRCGLIVVELDRAAEVEPLLDLLRVSTPK
jgi:hypothetical protein